MHHFFLRENGEIILEQWEQIVPSSYEKYTQLRGSVNINI